MDDSTYCMFVIMGSIPVAQYIMFGLGMIFITPSIQMNQLLIFIPTMLQATFFIFHMNFTRQEYCLKYDGMH